MGITGVPVVIIDGKWAITGKQPSDVFIQVRYLVPKYKFPEFDNLSRSLRSLQFPAASVLTGKFTMTPIPLDGRHFSHEITSVDM